MNFLYFSNNSLIAKSLDPINEIDTAFIDLEIIGKEKRQKGTNSLISYHEFEDISKFKEILNNTFVGVRINPIHSNTKKEIDECIKRGADVIMLPMFKNRNEVLKCLDYINNRCKLDLLLETPEALQKIREFPLDEIRFCHFGINDLSLAFKYKNMFECFFKNILNYPIEELKTKNKIFGIGGIGASDAKPISPILIFRLNYFFGSSRTILSRNFLNKIDKSSRINANNSALKEFNLLKKVSFAALKEWKSFSQIELEYKKLNL